MFVKNKRAQTLCTLRTDTALQNFNIGIKKVMSSLHAWAELFLEYIQLVPTFKNDKMGPVQSWTVK